MKYNKLIKKMGKLLNKYAKSQDDYALYIRCAIYQAFENGKELPKLYWSSGNPGKKFEKFSGKSDFIFMHSDDLSKSIFDETENTRSKIKEAIININCVIDQTGANICNNIEEKENIK